MYDRDDQRYECIGCDRWQPWLDDLGLCATCSAKLDRDMLRQRAWDYSVSAFACPPEQYEQLRDKIIADYGAALELIAPD